LLDVRHGGDAAHRERLLSEFLYPWRDEVLGRAGVAPGATVLDVGTGDGLIGFGALDRVGPGGHVIFSDISQDLLDHCREAAEAEGVLGRCSFLRAGADSLVGVAGASVDVVTTRSVLIYVKGKAAAFREFYRVLRPGGRVSLFEPVNRLHVVPGRFDGYDIGRVAVLAAKVQAFYDALQPPDSDPMLDFDDRDLVRHAEEAGFAEVHLDLRLDVEATVEPCPWDRFLRRSGNPLEPPFGEVLAAVLDPAEAAQFTAYLRPLVESGTGQLRRAVAYLVAVKGPVGMGAAGTVGRG
jgi:ubiquinone/menaquinone biosynthesis C-methylase UbiE